MKHLCISVKIVETIVISKCWEKRDIRFFKDGSFHSVLYVAALNEYTILQRDGQTMSNRPINVVY